jgi:hypothetical protein
MASAQTETAGLQVLQAFETAIRSGRLSGIPTAENYAGLYMFMGRYDGRDMFKHIETRQYLS